MNRAPFQKVAAWPLLAALGLVFVPTEAWAQQTPAASKPADSGPKSAETKAPPKAEPPNEEAIQEAARRYDLGLRLYAEGEFRLAVIEFERTYQITTDYRVLYNIGQVRIQLGNYAKAIGALKEYLKAGAEAISEERRKAVETDLEMLASRTGTVRVVANVNGADILVDDLIVGQAPLAAPILLDAGEHKVTARAPGYDARTLPLTLAGRDSELVKIDLVKIPDRSDRIIVKEVPKESNTTWMIATWTATGVLAVGAGVTGGLGIKAANDLDDMRSEEGSTNDERDSASRRSKTLLLAADVMGGLAIVTGGVALYFTLSGPSGDAKEAPKANPKPAPAVKTGLVLGPNRIALKGEF